MTAGAETWIDPFEETIQRFFAKRKGASMTAEQAITKLKEYPPDEPVFVIRGGDMLAESVVLFWVREAIRAGVSTDKIHGAVGIAKECRDWPHKKIPD